MSKTPFHYAPELRPAFLAHMAARLDALICSQTKDLLKDADALTPVLSVSIMVFLSAHGTGTVSDIARIDGQSHQLVKSRLKPLEMLQLVRAKPDPLDDRRRILSLTAKGKRDAKRVLAVCEQVAAAVAHLQDELGVALTDAIMQAENSLSRTPLSKRRGK
jgi:DNA-binding MarR family transcriptional regulator